MKSVVLASYDVLPSAKGAAQHILSNAQNLQDRYKVSLLSLGTKPLYGYRHFPIDLHISNWLSRSIEFHHRIKKIFEKNPFDIYHVRSPWEGLAVPEGKTIIYEVNGLASIEMPYHYPKMIERPQLRQRLRYLELALLDRARLIICTNPITQLYLEDLGVAAERIVIVPNCPSFEPLQNPDSTRGPVLRLCYIGTLSKWQGLHNAIRALERLENTAVQLRILSPSKGRKEFERWLSKRDISNSVSLEMPLPRDQLGAFLAEHDAGLAPLIPCDRNLIQGCMPIKILDYMAAGIPVIASDIPVNRHILGAQGYFYRPYSTDSLCQSILRVAEEPISAGQQVDNNLLHLQKHFSRERQRELLLQSYASIN